ALRRCPPESRLSWSLDSGLHVPPLAAVQIRASPDASDPLRCQTGLVEATEAVTRVRPSLVLLDIQLPDFDGFEVARRLTAQPCGPVVVLTSTREASDYGGGGGAGPARAGPS